MNYDIKVLKSKRPGRHFLIEQNDDLAVLKLFIHNVFELRKIRTFIIDCIVDDMSSKEIFDLLKVTNFVNNLINNDKPKEKVVEKKPEYKMRKFFGTYYFSYTK